MDKTILVIGSVTAEQYQPVLDELSHNGQTPKIIRFENIDSVKILRRADLKSVDHMILDMSAVDSLLPVLKDGLGSGAGIEWKIFFLMVRRDYPDIKLLGVHDTEIFDIIETQNDIEMIVELLRMNASLGKELMS